ncbi:protein TonB [Novosphingobium kunmingense]|uniref:Protein TonB n=1 Tax=Novosphingobium kunmingense TaxID=1211806 RepID=A0A2N0H6W4_9SPHN|nr:hypothetical protein [Novosphingobium kunmingense]PKB14630.1 protein TonB [Novosphingobium kunmingense]
MRDDPDMDTDWLARMRDRYGARAPSLALTLLVEAALILAVLSIGLTPDQPKTRPGTRLVSVAIRPADDDKPQTEKSAPARTAQSRVQPRVQPKSADVVTPVVAPQVAPAAPPPPAFIALPKNQMAALDISRVQRTASAPGPTKALYGPADMGVAGDSKRVGSAPNGQPLFAASWYREPSDGELAGYLSTADGPGYALIACRTVADWRVDSCVALDEYPDGSNMARAVLAAAWQFRVRPPRLGGVYKVGEWVRIRIDYELRPRRGG